MCVTFVHHTKNYQSSLLVIDWKENGARQIMVKTTFTYVILTLNGIILDLELAACIEHVQEGQQSSYLATTLIISSHILI